MEVIGQNQAFLQHIIYTIQLIGTVYVIRLKVVLLTCSEVETGIEGFTIMEYALEFVPRSFAVREGHLPDIFTGQSVLGDQVVFPCDLAIQHVSE